MSCRRAIADHECGRHVARRAAHGLLAAGLLCAGAARAGDEPFQIRVMAANTTSRNLQSYPNPGPGARFFEALRPDVVLIQEFNVNGTRNAPNDDHAVSTWVADVFGPDYHWTREPGGDSIPNGVISRWPILESGQWADSAVGNRDFAFARIDLPGEVDLWAVSVHLLTRGAAVRAAEARALVAAIRAHPVPDEDFLVIGGDFNTDHRREPAIEVFSELVNTLGPYPHDGTDNEGTNARRKKPYDWVLADPDLEALSTATEVGEFVFEDGLVFDSRIFPLDDLEESFFPVTRDDSGAPQMQHMPVVRDFALSAPGPGDSPERPRTVHLDGGPIDFGTVSPAAGPFIDRSVALGGGAGVSLTAVAFGGAHADEFDLTSPSLDAGPVELTGDDLELTITWAPDGGVEGLRRVTATLVLDADPGAFELQILGTVAAEGDGPAPPPAAEPFDLGGLRVEQTGGDAALTIPAGTVVPPGGLLVIGRAAAREEFEAFWGELDPRVVYLNGLEIVGEPGFPIINGGEHFRVVAPDGRTTDPSGHGDIDALPGMATPPGRAYQRLSAVGAAFAARAHPPSEATPGVADGEPAGSMRLVLTEFSDASGPGNFRFEFVELFWDAVAPE